MKDKRNSVIFDLDGTLIDTKLDIAEACNKALESEGLPSFPEEKFDTIIGWGLKKTITLAMPEDLRENKELHKKLYNKQVENYINQPCERTVIYPGITELLSELIVKGIPMAVWTNKDEDIALTILQKLFPDNPFQVIAGTVDHRPRKPDPGASDYILGILKTEREETLYVGDSEVDMETAINSGFFPLAVPWGYRSRDILKKAGARAFAETPADILNFLKLS